MVQTLLSVSAWPLCYNMSGIIEIHWKLQIKWWIHKMRLKNRIFLWDKVHFDFERWKCSSVIRAPENKKIVSRKCTQGTHIFNFNSRVYNLLVYFQKLCCLITHGFFIMNIIDQYNFLVFVWPVNLHFSYMRRKFFSMSANFNIQSWLGGWFWLQSFVQTSKD